MRSILYIYMFCDSFCRRSFLSILVVHVSSILLALGCVYCTAASLRYTCFSFLFFFFFFSFSVITPPLLSPLFLSLSLSGFANSWFTGRVPLPRRPLSRPRVRHLARRAQPGTRCRRRSSAGRNPRCVPQVCF